MPGPSTATSDRAGRSGGRGSRSFLLDPYLWGAIIALVGLAFGGEWLIDQQKAEEKQQKANAAERSDGFGFVAVRVKGGRSAVVSIDGKSVGRAPLSQRLTVGKHTIKVSETRGRKKKTRTRKITVTEADTRRSPQIVLIAF